MQQRCQHDPWEQLAYVLKEVELHAPEYNIKETDLDEELVRATAATRRPGDDDVDAPGVCAD